MAKEYKLSPQRLKELQDEMNYLKTVREKEVAELIKEARSFGDLSENFEYKAAKQEKNRNESRIRFLENMIKTAVVIEDHSGADAVGLYDKVTVYLEEDEEELDAEKFESRLELESIEVRPDGEFCFWFEDGDLFWGHSITVEGTLEGGPEQADIQG